MPRRPGNKAPQPTPPSDDSLSGAEQQTQRGRAKVKACRFGGLACAITLDQETGQVQQHCILMYQLKDQPPKGGVVDPPRIHQRVEEAREMGENRRGEYLGQCAMLPELEKVCDAKLAQYPLDTQNEQE